jgi:hypothetical protein
MRRLILALSLLGMLFMAAPQPALAFSFFKNDCNSDTGSTTVCKEKGNSSNPLTGCSAPDTSGNETGCGTGLLMKITNFIAYIAGAAAIIIIVVGGVRYILAGGNNDAVSGAKNSIVQALIGLAVIALAKIIITYVLTNVVT